MVNLGGGRFRDCGAAHWGGWRSLLEGRPRTFDESIGAPFPKQAPKVGGQPSPGAKPRQDPRLGRFMGGRRMPVPSVPAARVGRGTTFGHGQIDGREALPG